MESHLYLSYKSRHMTKNILSMNMALLSILFFVTSCTIQGEQICGTWYSNGELGKMKIEITPWKGKFYGYLMEYEEDGKMVKGAKTEDHIILTGLVFKEGQYINGIFYADDEGKETCGTTINLTSVDTMSIEYNCSGEVYHEIWTKNTYPILKEKKGITSESNVTNIQTLSHNADKPSKIISATSGQDKLIQKDRTTPHASFFVIGYKEIVSYTNDEIIQSTINDLWTKVYNEDFSSLIQDRIVDEKMYVIYSDYDNPKGSMSITLGYNVQHLTSIPDNLSGVNIPSSTYFTFPLKGTSSDYSQQIISKWDNAIMSRSPQSIDFEEYSFDANYNVTEGKLWIGAK